MINLRPSDPNMYLLWCMCANFIEKQKVNGPETVAQSDRVIENAYALLKDICDLVGYYEDPDAEDYPDE